MKVTEHLLTILAEECAEVAQRASKALRFGLEEIQEGQELTNAQRIEQEFADLTAVFAMLQLNPPTREQIDAKREKVIKFIEYSQECGTLDEPLPTEDGEPAPGKVVPMGKKVKPCEPFRYPPGSVKVGRNDPCPCGSGQKLKKCCGDTRGAPICPECAGIHEGSCDEFHGEVKDAPIEPEN